MPIDMAHLIEMIEPERTVLLFGSGSSTPSGAPKTKDIIEHLGKKIGISSEDFNLSEISTLFESRLSRRSLVESVRELFQELHPTGGLLNLPLYDWKSIFTTNYDDLIEQSYELMKKDLDIYTSDFDFTARNSLFPTKLFKLHGTIDKDIVDGYVFRMVLTELDNDQATNYREKLYDRLEGDLAGADLLIVGHSLSDPDIRAIAARAAQLNLKAGGAWKVYMLCYTEDLSRATLVEQKNISVCFGGIDDLFSQLAKKLPVSQAGEASVTLSGLTPSLAPITVDVAHAVDLAPHASGMFNGWPATYGDISSGLTFDRVASEDMNRAIREDNCKYVILLGACGVGKTTSCRQTVLMLLRSGFLCWEHQGEHLLLTAEWLKTAVLLAENGQVGILFIDDAHNHLPEINNLVDELESKSISSLKLVIASTRNHWAPRIKTPVLFKRCKTFHMGRLKQAEIDRLLNLVDAQKQIRDLVEPTFSGFSRVERRRRLVERCDSEMFVCLKNIFASEKFDDILLREFAGLQEHLQDIYRHIAAMESAGVKVHRQLIVRLLGISAAELSLVLQNLTDIVIEYPVSEKEGVFGWKTRHQCIAATIARYKFSDLRKLVELYKKIIANISPTYDIEIRTIRGLCTEEGGIRSIRDRQVQNTLLRQMISVVPGERVPRHRLIRNLIGMGEFGDAEVEIRIFENDFGRKDGPVSRYRIELLLERATRTEGILSEDRLAILEQARKAAVSAVGHFPDNRSLLEVFCRVGLEIKKLSGDSEILEDALLESRRAEERIGDPEISRMITRYQRLAEDHVLRNEAVDEGNSSAVDSILDEEYG